MGRKCLIWAVLWVFQMQLHLLTERFASTVLQQQLRVSLFDSSNNVLAQIELTAAEKGVEQFFIAKINTGCARAFLLLHQNGFQVVAGSKAENCIVDIQIFLPVCIMLQ